MAAHNELGKWGECKAAEFLREKGLYIRHIDWRDKHRDLDIVAIDADMTTIHVVEVKTRSTAIYGEPEESIDLEKKNNIIKATARYLRAYHLEHLAVQYDTISVVGTPETECKIIYKEKAFTTLDSYLFYEQRRKQAWYHRRHRPGTWD